MNTHPKVCYINKLLIVVFGLVGIWSSGLLAGIGCTISLVIWVYDKETVLVEKYIIDKVSNITM